MQKIRLKKNDKVKIFTGKDLGKIGKILKVVQKNNRVIVEGINIIKSHQKPNMQNKQGGIVEKEASVNISNVMLMCNHCMKPTRIKSKKFKNSNKLIRICSKCSETIDS